MVIRIRAKMWDDNRGLRMMISGYERVEIRLQTIVYFLVPRLTLAPYEFTLCGQSNEMKDNLRGRLVRYKWLHVRVPAYNDN
jgi:hypothetical protein